MLLQLRPYQEEGVVSIFNYFAGNQGNPVVALPTGTGKSFVIAEFIRRAIQCYPATRIMVLTHVKELVRQNHAELLELWPSAPAGIYSAGLNRRDAHLPITFCGIASIARRVADFGFIHLVIIDECHMVSSKESTQYAKVIEQLRLSNPLVKVIGLTATPFRLGVGMITEGRLFTDICCNYCTLERFNELVDAGYIAPLIPRQTEHELSTDGVGITNGEFNIDELQAAVDKDAITRGALGEAVALARDRKHWLVFCTGTAHADHARDILIGMGISAVSVHSALPGGDKERDANIALFKAGGVQAMVGVGVFTTGFNFKPIDCIVVLRPTMSTVLWVQLLGRGTRPSPETGKVNCLVLDFAANTRRLGPINDPVIPRRKGRKGSAFVPFKVCPKCSTYNHTRVRMCIQCGYEFPVVFAAAVNAATDELIRREAKAVHKEEREVTAVVVETFPVQRVEYSKHISRDRSKPPSFRVSYYCGLQVFNDWLCFEHSGYALHKAHEAWRQMAGYVEAPPATVDEAMARVDAMQPPSAIRVLMKGKYPEVCGYDFDPATAANRRPKSLEQQIADDDIPF